MSLCLPFSPLDSQLFSTQIPLFCLVRSISRLIGKLLLFLSLISVAYFFSFFVIETVVLSCSPRRTRNLSPYFSSLLPIQRKNQYEKHAARKEERKEQEEPDPEPLMILMRLVSLSLSSFSVESLGSEREQEHKLISLSLSPRETTRSRE